MPRARLELAGQRFGMLVAEGVSHVDPGGNVQWCCRCDCGREYVCGGSSLKAGATRSCGCWHHGHRRCGTGSPTYYSWSSMRRRCLNLEDSAYAAYGGRGITICERWDIFENFLVDMGERPRGTSIDRIDNDGDYEPGNCQWATSAQQNQNQRRTKLDWLAVHDIRWQAGQGETQASIASLYGVTQSLVSGVVAGTLWCPEHQAEEGA